MKILIVDDSTVIRGIIKRILTAKGLSEDSFIEAPDGSRALEITGQEQVDMFLVDRNMPGIDGIELITRLRGMEQHKKTPVVMITAEGAKYNVDEAFSAGVTDYIEKPIKPDELWSKVSGFLK